MKTILINLFTVTVLWSGCYGMPSRFPCRIRPLSLLPQLSRELPADGLTVPPCPGAASGWRDLKLCSPEAALIKCQSTKAWPPLSLLHFETSLKGSSNSRAPSLRNLLGFVAGTLDFSLYPILRPHGFTDTSDSTVCLSEISASNSTSPVKA